MTTAPSEPAGLLPERERLSLSATQLVASGLAAMSATVAASFFGVAGTVIGAALGSMISVVGNAVYSYSLRRTRQRVRRTLDVAVAHRFAAQPAEVMAATSRAAGDTRLVHEPSAVRGALVDFMLRPKRLAVAVLAMFVGVLAVTTAFEAASGQPLSATVTGNHGSGVSLGGGSEQRTAPSSTPPSRSADPSPSGSSSTSTVPVSPSATPSDSATPSQHTSPSQSAGPSQSASQGGSSGAPAPSGSASAGASPAG